MGVPNQRHNLSPGADKGLVFISLKLPGDLSSIHWTTSDQFQILSTRSQTGFVSHDTGAPWLEVVAAPRLDCGDEIADPLVPLVRSSGRMEPRRPENSDQIY